jgi:hypothetical protein
MPRPPISTLELLSVGITSPQNGATLIGTAAGVPVTVWGNAECLIRNEEEIYEAVAKVEVSIAGGAFQMATPNPAEGWANWSFQGNITAPGPTKIIARVTSGSYGSPVKRKTETSEITIIAQTDVTAPNFTINAPATVQGNGPTFPTTISGTASDDVMGIRSIEWSLNGRDFYPATALSNGWATWNTQITLPGLGAYTITVRATDHANNTSVKTVIITAIDTVPPELRITSPQDNATITGTDNGATIDVTGTAFDALTNIRSVEWDVDGKNQYTAATPQAPGNWANWSAKVPIPSPGLHRIAVRTFDNAGNSFAVTQTVNIALPFEAKDPNDIVSPIAYLADLIDFTTRRVKVSQTGQTITAKQLAETFYQPFDRLLKPELRAVTKHPVHQVRLSVEILRKYLAQVQPGLMGDWRFNEGSGTIASDTSGKGNQGTLQGASWSAGRNGKALSFDGVDDYVAVGTSPILAMKNVVTISAWVNPQGAGSSTDGGGIIVCREAEYEVGRFPDGTLRWAFANQKPGWAWMNTGYVIPLNQWTHIAVVYQAGVVSSYANGQLIHRYEGEGTIGTVNPQIQDFRIGGRQHTSQHFHGLIDEVRIYNRALSADAVRILANDQDPTAQLLAKAEVQYRQMAYQTLLNKLGTSYEEIRLARLADDVTRQRLVEQLGLSQVEQLDRLFFPLEQVTEAVLEQRFGLSITTGDPLQVNKPINPEILAWQLEQLHQQWQVQDNTVTVPIIDPDLIHIRELKDATPGNPAYDLWQARQQWLATQLSNLKSKRGTGANALEGFTVIVNAVLGSLPELLKLADDRQQGKEIDAQLQAKHLSLQAFLHLLRIHQLAKTGTVLESEWADVYAILVQAQKQKVYPDWRQAEQQKQLTLSPDYFQVVADVEMNLPLWRSTPELRQQWVDTLTARISQQQGLVDAWQKLIDETETATLPVLRDGLIRAIGGNVNSALTNELTQQLAIDVQNSASQKLTRITQAIATLQAILFDLRTGQFEETDSQLPPSPAASWEMNLTPDYPEEFFDREWAWMGSYATWRAAMFVFGYPENLLLPSLREVHEPRRPQDPTVAFLTLTDNLRGVQNLTPQQAREEAKSYLDAIKQLLGASYPAELQTFQLTDQRSEKDLIELAAKARRLFGNTPLSEIPTYLKEIFFFVPLQLALQLQKSGQYLTALDWFQTVYAYNLPVAQRKIYPGLVLEESLATEYRRTINWLLDSLNPHDIAATRATAYTRFTLISLVRCLLEFADSEFTRDTNESIPRARSLYMLANDLLRLPDMQPPRNAAMPFPPNPVVQSLELHTELSLMKLRQGRNIAGMERQAEEIVPTNQPISDMPTIGSGGQLIVSRPIALKPTPYYYAVLIDRAKQLVSIAQQIETAYLSAMEKRDAETYNLIKAGQDLRLAGAGVQLQDLRVNEANRGIALAQVQQQRSQTQRDTYQQWLTSGLNRWESTMLKSYQKARDARLMANFFDTGAQMAQAVISAASGGPMGLGAAPAVAMAMMMLQGRSVANSMAIDAEATGQIAAANASFERRSQEWQLQKSLAEKDLEIGMQQIQLAQDHSRVVGQERAISQMQADHAQAVVDFLANKFTNAELYDWMSGILGRVYSYFLQQATAVAQLAQSQLAFERQEVPPTYIQADYWQAPSDGSGEKGRDRRGLTGSARLLQDIYQLDQYAFETNKRKLQLTQTFSLAQLFPYEFQQFRETGRLPFATPMELFDRAFPGHYLRLIKRVRTSVIALIPPTQGIRATLMTNGVSRVVIGGDQFQTVVVRRNPEMVALTSPTNATGLFELDAQSDLLLPFEGMGVDTAWELQLPKAANSFDYETISDVLITVEYTALHSFDYQQQVIRSLKPEVSGDRAFSLRDQFPDVWYSLHNPDQSNQPMVVNLRLDRADFPPNLINPKIQQITLYAIPTQTAPIHFTLERLQLKQGNEVITGGTTTAVEGVITTRRPNVSWSMLRGKSPAGEWQLVLSDTNEMRSLFQQEKIQDILLVITYSATIPNWLG